jgi:alkylation response protein AidB-like acyl-CoA dehydrogenase
LSQDPFIRYQIAELQADVDVARLLCYRVAWLQSKGQVPSYEASAARVVGHELSQKVARVGMKILGLRGQLTPGTPGAPLNGAMERYYLSSIANTIRAGTSEIQRNIIAQRGLGLARSKGKE